MRRSSTLIGGVLAFYLLLGIAEDTQSWPLISAERLRAWLDQSDPPLILDVRGRADYRTKTIAGAMNAGGDPKGYLADGRGGRLVLLMRGEENSEDIAAWFTRLLNAGHDVWILQGGLAGWIEAGGATETPEFSYTQPGRVPFLIPRGLCEGGEPAHVFE